MPSESVAGFLDHARASRVLFPEQVEQLIRQPDLPQSGLDALCEYLLARGVLTRFQAEAIRESRGHDLNYAGYPVVDQIGPCPGGMAYRSLHPSLRTPLLLRRLRVDWLAPADTPGNYVARARAFGMFGHPHMVHLLDAGVLGEEVYLVIDAPHDAADLETLTNEIGGAMPGFLAAEYGRAVASVLRAAHERGGFHGEVRPGNLLVAPVMTKSLPDGRQRRKPAPDAVVRLAELGLVPIRPPAVVAVPDRATLAYLPPERLDATIYDARGDIYGLGATLYFLLTASPPFVADDPEELLHRVRQAEPKPLATLRPDLPREFVSLVTAMMDKRPEHRVGTVAEVERELARFCRPGTPRPVEPAVPMAMPTMSGYGSSAPLALPADPIPAAEPLDGWGWAPAGPPTSPSSDPPAEPPPTYRRGMSAAEKLRTRLLLILGGILHLTGITLLVLWLTGALSPSPPKLDTRPDTKPAKSR